MLRQIRKVGKCETGCDRRERYKGNPATCHVVVVTDVGLKFRVRGQSQVNGEGAGGVRCSGVKMSKTRATLG